MSGVTGSTRTPYHPLVPSALVEPVTDPASRTGDRAHPLTVGQETAWLFERLFPEALVHNLLFSATLDGPLDEARLEAALARVLARHEPLRTRFPVDADGRPGAVVGASGPLFQRTDLSRALESERQARLAALRSDRLLTPYDLERGPLVRLDVVRLAPDRHLLLAGFHHLVADGTSWPLLLDEVALLHGGRPLAPLPATYGAHAARQRALLSDGTLAAHEARWLDRLAGARAPGMLTRRVPSGGRSFRGEVLERPIPVETAQGLRALAEELTSTPFRVQLAAFFLLLHRLTGEEDVVARTGLTGRPGRDLAPLAGFFLANVPIRADLGGSATFADVLRRVDARLREALESEEYPVELALRRLHPDHPPSHGAVHGLSFTKLPRRRERLAGSLVLTEEPYLPGGAPLDLSLYTQDGPGGSRLVSMHDTGLFERRDVAALLDRYVDLVGELACGGGARLPVRRRAPRSLRREAPEPEPPTGRTLQDRIEAVAARRADGLAVVTPHGSWSYGRLLAEANHVADALQERLGEGPKRVGLLFGGRPAMPAAVLGALKAGGTYVPLDPGTPAHRLAFQLADSRCDVLVTDGGDAALAGELTAGGLPLLDLDRTPRGRAPRRPAAAHAAARDGLAYVLYTSGSTGVPKGVLQTHENVLHFMRCYVGNLGITPDDRLSLLSTYAFDAGVMDLFAALLSGAALCPWDLRRDGLAGLAAWIAGTGVTVLHATPTLFRHLVATRRGADFSRVRWVVLGGEEANRADFELFRETFPEGCRLVNGYGPTESSVSLQHVLHHGSLVFRPKLPIGLPVFDTEARLLDESGRPAAPGAVGEIVLRSRHLAIGYWERPEPTAAAFLPDPEGGDRRLYRTGDLGRELPDGTLEFAGRRDTQIKLHGVRVELGEIEAVLATHPSVGEAAVTAAGPGDSTSLAAYAAPAEGRTVSPRELARFLAERLPSPMLPSAYVVLERLPRTPNGKVDRAALPAPAAGARGTRSPLTAGELKLAGIWKGLLGVPEVRAGDSFFDLGGDSLLALRLLALAENDFGVRLPVAALFEAPTLEELARRLASATGVGSSSTVFAVQAGGARPPLFVVPAAHGSVWPEELDMVGLHALARALGDDQPLHAFCLDPAEDEFPPSVPELAARFVADLRRVQPDGPYHLAGCSLGGVIAFEMARQLRMRGDGIARLVLLDTCAPGYPRSRRPFEPERLVSWALGLRALARRVPRFGARLLRLPSGQRAAALHDRVATALGAGPPAPRRRLPRYTASPLTGPVTLLRCVERPRDGRDWTDPSNGWAPFVSPPLRVVPIPGLHHEILREPGLSAAARALTSGADGQPDPGSRIA